MNVEHREIILFALETPDVRVRVGEHTDLNDDYLNEVLAEVRANEDD